jgi:V-type H+-transporting ATPase subunit a
MKYAMPPMYQYRFLLVQMGFFAVFAGFMYNDLFGICSLDLFGSRWFIAPDKDGVLQPRENFNQFNENLPDKVGPYPFGLDPAWHGTSNELLFVNNLKMKLSVLIGVTQMLLGVALRFSNAIYDKSMVDFCCECVPMLVFMLGFFGYMDFMILYKWTHAIGGPKPSDDFHFDVPGANMTAEPGSPASIGARSNGPPGLINSLICMAMFTPDPSPLYPSAASVGAYLMAATAIAVPCILGPKPFILRWRHNRKMKQRNNKAQELGIAVEDLAEDEEGGSGGHGHGKEFEFGEILIHQIIETIEYVLGTVSHTASYLRIWALSLAHQQLSLVFYTKTLQMGMTLTDPILAGIVMWFLFGAWFGVTLFVLLGMDVLECFLHTLRLHWVEFQSKFYHNEGTKFEPYNIREVILDTD